MQVADDHAARAARLAAGREALAQLPPLSRPQPSGPAQFALSYIAQSTQLSGADKKFLTGLVAIADELGNDDGKLFEAILKLARVLESRVEPGTYRATAMREIMDEYWERREALRGKGAEGIVSARAAIAQAAVAKGAPEVAMETGTLEA